MLREVRDTTPSQTAAGTSFMAWLGDAHCAFPHAAAGLEREHLALGQAVATVAAPALRSAALAPLAEPGSEGRAAAYGAPAIAPMALAHAGVPARGRGRRTARLRVGR